MAIHRNVWKIETNCANNSQLIKFMRDVIWQNCKPQSELTFPYDNWAKMSNQTRDTDQKVLES